MKFSKKQLIWAGVIITIVAIIVLINSSKKPAANPNTTTVKRGDITQEVSVTGRVIPTSAVDLAFEKAGRVTAVNVAVGNHINIGSILAEVESSAARGSLAQAEARLAELTRGSRPEELAVKKAQLATSVQNLNNAYSGISDILNDAYAKADDALHTKTTGIFNGYQSTSYKYTFFVCDSQLATNSETLRDSSEKDIALWRTENQSAKANPSKDEQVADLDSASAHLAKLSIFLDSVSQALSLDCTISNTALDTYRTNINLARTNINTAISNVNTKEQTIAALALTVSQTTDELALLEAGTAREVIAAQQGLVLAATGELAKYRIVAPISGVITKADAKVGENSTLGVTSFSIISDTSFKVEAYVPEADIAKINISDTAKVTLDAYGADVTFDATVTEIDPAETIIDNVPTYKTTLHFTKNDPRIKSGMTANTDILTASREGVLFAPGRSIITRNGEKYIRTVNADNSTTDVAVTTGLKASDGTVEILSGVTESATIIMSPTD
ncbi:MAG: HlyD family efflux transporter periplasmic adaptor subunit [Candidatus Paceibacterota bacterium]|jgi:HlyD family secretion protein